MSSLSSLRRATAGSRLDRAAIGLSGLCVVHCVATSVLVALTATAGGLLGSHWIHEVGLSLAIALGALALGRGALDHGHRLPAAVGALGLALMALAMTLPHDGPEALVTILGVSVLAFGHHLNRRAAR